MAYLQMFLLISSVPDFIRVLVGNLAESIGFDVETLNYTLGMFLCYPLGLIMTSLPYGQVRHLFSFLLGAFLLQFTLGVQWIHHVITSLVCYAMFAILPRSASKTLVPFFVMAYLLLGHLHRQYINYLGWDLDFTGTQMVLTQKLYMMAYNLYDGEQLAKGKDDRAAKKCAPFALKKLPNLLEYLGYTFCFSNVLSGPAYEFATYCHPCDGSLLYKPDGTSRGKIPSNVWPTLRPFFTCLVCLGIFVVGGAHFPLMDPTDPQGNLPVVLQPEFLEKPWIQRYAYLWVALLILRQKYYFAWKNAEGANNIWFAGFEGFDEQGNVKGWRHAVNMNIIDFETASNIQTLSKEWNQKTSAWLTKYVYIRTGGSLAAVYTMSAVWHGFYPGYYIFFLSVPLMTIVQRLAAKKISPNYSAKKWSPYGIACILMTSFVVEYMVSAFALLDFSNGIALWKSHYFLGHVLCIVAYALLINMPSPKKKAE
jgi:hypothetical protein